LRRTRAAAAQGARRARGLKPDPFFTPDALSLVRTASFDDGLPSITSSNWIIEAVVERLDVKQSLFEKEERHRAADAIGSSDTSGVPIAALAEGRSEAFRRRVLGTHFFNPPRYLQLLEVIPTPETDPAVLQAISWFADHRLGKGVVVAKDTPNFIANHLGLFGLMQIMGTLTFSAKGDSAEESSVPFTIEEIDAITGRAIGRPRSATFT